MELEVNHKNLERILKTYIKSGISLFIWGTTGIGKSQTVDKVALDESKVYNRKYVVWHKLSKEEKMDTLQHPEKYYILIDKRLSQMDPSDLRGLPNLNGHDTVEWKPPLWLKVISHKDARGILFLDEINLSPPSLQASAYQIINDHALDELSISKNVSIVAAGNRRSDKANTYEIPKPLQNRFGHIVLKVPTIDDWINWAIKKNIDSRIISFLRFKTSSLFKFEPNSADNAFPTPRSWGEFCSSLIKGKSDKTESDRDIISQLASTAVGSGTSIEFVAFLKLRETINLQSILNNPEKVEEINQIDLKFSLISLISDWYENNFKKQDLEKILNIANRMEDEYSILMLKLVKEKHVSSFQNQITKIPIWKEIGNKYGKYLVD
jgi:hypothetical protein